MKIIPLSEGAFTIDKTRVFVPFDEDNDHLRDRPAGSLLVEVQPFVVVTGSDILLLDTGLGFTGYDGVLQIHAALAAQGIEPFQVTKVLMSHLHKDHAGGMAYTSERDGAPKLSFPSARYYIQKQELELALAGQSSSYISEELVSLPNSPQVEMIEGEGFIDNYIGYRMTSAHSRYHQVFWIREGGKTIFFGGDDAPQFSQMKSRYTAKYDFDGKKCMELRQQWWEQGTAEGWTFLFYHDIKTPVYRASK